MGHPGQEWLSVGDGHRVTWPCSPMATSADLGTDLPGAGDLLFGVLRPGLVASELVVAFPGRCPQRAGKLRVEVPVQALC